MEMEEDNSGSIEKNILFEKCQEELLVIFSKELRTKAQNFSKIDSLEKANQFSNYKKRNASILFDDNIQLLQQSGINYNTNVNNHIIQNDYRFLPIGPNDMYINNKYVDIAYNVTQKPVEYNIPQHFHNEIGISYCYICNNILTEKKNYIDSCDKCKKGKFKNDPKYIQKNKNDYDKSSVGSKSAKSTLSVGSSSKYELIPVIHNILGRPPEIIKKTFTPDSSEIS